MGYLEILSKNSCIYQQPNSCRLLIGVRLNPVFSHQFFKMLSVDAGFTSSKGNIISVLTEQSFNVARFEF